MKILFDHQAFSGAKYGGVARYYYDLMFNLKYSQKIDIQLALKYSNNDYIQKGDIRKVVPFKFYFGFARTNQIFSHLNRAASAYYLYKQDFDVFHPTYFKDYFLPFLGKKPFVLTHHDVIPEKFPEKYASLDGFDKQYKKNILHKANKIIAVSENTKNDIVDIFDIKPEKVAVIYHSTHFANFSPNTNFAGSSYPFDYLLYVGNRGNYKNFVFFVEAIVPLLRKNPNLVLLCAGNGGFTAEEKQIFANNQIINQVKHHVIESDEDLYFLYKRALAFVYPSLYEGFGIPILEAFACQCPVVLSNRSCFPEVAQEAALYFNPIDKEDILYQITQIVENTSLRNSLIEKGKARLTDFSPDITAKKTLDVYHSVR